MRKEIEDMIGYKVGEMVYIVWDGGMYQKKIESIEIEIVDEAVVFVHLVGWTGDPFNISNVYKSARQALQTIIPKEFRSEWEIKRKDEK